jgi:hypothetical protein
VPDRRRLPVDGQFIERNLVQDRERPRAEHALPLCDRLVDVVDNVPDVMNRHRSYALACRHLGLRLCCLGCLFHLFARQGASAE